MEDFSLGYDFLFKSILGQLVYCMYIIDLSTMVLGWYEFSFLDCITCKFHYTCSFLFFFPDHAPKPISKDDRSEEPVDIMRKLEQAIANGNHKEASLLAKEVTKLQISTKLSLKELTEKKTNNKKVEKIK